MGILGIGKQKENTASDEQMEKLIAKVLKNQKIKEEQDKEETFVSDEDIVVDKEDKEVPEELPEVGDNLFYKDLTELIIKHSENTPLENIKADLVNIKDELLKQEIVNELSTKK